MKKCSLFIVLLILSCQHQDTRNADDLTALGYSVTIGKPNSEGEDFGAENIYLHFTGTHYILNLNFMFTQDDTIALAGCALLEFDDTVDVAAWIDMRHCDATNIYTGIDPERHSGTGYTIAIQIHDLYVDKPGSPWGYHKANFNAAFENIRFEQCDKFISSLSLDSLIIYSYPGFALIGPADRIVFTDPPSGKSFPKVVPVGISVPIELLVLDNNGNRVDSSYSVTCVSIKPELATVTDSIRITDTTGSVTFHAEIIAGRRNDIIPIVAALTDNPAVTDTTVMEVGD